MGLHIAERLKKAREAVGLSLEKAAELSGVGRSSIGNYENGQGEPKFSQLARLANAYRRSVDFFLSESAPADGIMLWRDPPSEELSVRKLESEFRTLCEQYHRLEQLQEDRLVPSLPTCPSSTMDYREAETLADHTRQILDLGDIPACSLLPVLEKNGIKVFHLSFAGSAISTRSDLWGHGILLNQSNTRWRRNFDLAHELFHLITWEIFRQADGSGRPTEKEERLANAFASRLLLPTDSVKEAIDRRRKPGQKIGFADLNDIAEAFDVSLEALLWRLKYLYDVPEETIQRYIAEAKPLSRPSCRGADGIVEELPQRYRRLAIRALQSGRLSLMQFAKYMRIGYRKAQDYLKDEDFTDEEISLSVA
jgi:XRE family transcriptional regulator, fatty acid utilization regulator